MRALLLSVLISWQLKQLTKSLRFHPTAQMESDGALKGENTGRKVTCTDSKCG